MPQSNALLTRCWLLLAAIALSGFIAGCTGLCMIPATSAVAADSMAAPADPLAKEYLAARLEMAAGENEPAAQRLEALRQTEDCPAEVFAALGEIYLGRKELDKARAVLEAGLQRNPGSVRLLLIEARLLRDSGKLDAAAQRLNQALAINPHRQVILENLSDVYLRRLRQVKTEQELTNRISELSLVYERLLEGRQGLERLAPLLVLNSLYLKTGKPERALAMAQEAVALNHREVRCRLALGETQEALKRPAEAIETYKQALILDPTNRETRQKLEKLIDSLQGKDAKLKFYVDLAGEFPADKDLQRLYARELLNQQQWPAAEKALSHIRQAWPDDVQSRIELARVWVQLGREREAIAEAQELSRQKGEIGPLAILSVAEALIARDRRPQALDLLTSFQQRDGDNENVTLALASILLELRQDQRATQLLEAFHQHHPEAFTGATLLVQVYCDQKRYNDAQALLGGLSETVRKQNAEDLQRMQADLYRRQKRYPEAMLILEGLTREHRDIAQYQLDAGAVCQEMGRAAAAEKFYREALRLDPQDPEAYNSLGYFYAETNQRLDEALTLVTKAMQLKPNAGHIHDSLGWVLYRRGDFKAAVEKLNTAVRLMDKAPDPVVFEHLGDAYAKLGQTSQARAAWSKALALDQNAAQVRQKLAGAH